jgi:virulence factor
MLRIGFVDHHLNNFHANKFLALLHGPLADLDARVSLAWESHPTGEDWCTVHGVPRAESAAQVAAEADAVMVLAPDNVEAHRDLCRLVFPAGKPALVDKFLAPSTAEALEIVRLAETHGVRLFSASSLRFAVELEAALGELDAPPVAAFARGMGIWDGYGVHTLSLVVGALGAQVARVIDTGDDHASSVTLEYADGRRAWLDVRSAANQWEVFPWRFGMRVGDRYVTGGVSDFDGFYAQLMRRAVQFFRTGETPVSTAEMLAVVGVLEAAGTSRARGGEWVAIPSPG